MQLKRLAISLTGVGLLTATILLLHPLTAGPKKPAIANPPPVDKPVMVQPLAFENTTMLDSSGRQIVTNPDSILVLVNKQRNLPADYVPPDLVIPKVLFPFKEDEPRKFMRAEAAAALEKLFAAAKEANHELYAISGYRSYEKQESIFASYARSKGEAEANKTSAKAGQSEHQTGLAMDITTRRMNFSLAESFGTTPEGLWLGANAHHFGFIIRYPKGKELITGYSYEPWHVRYVGREVAQYLYDNQLTLEEYFQFKYGY